MALKDFVIERRIYTLPGGATVEVRGLAPDDIAACLLESPEESKQVVDEMAEAGNDGASALVSLIPRFPALVARVIAMCADEPDSVDFARRLPLPTQVEIILGIYEMTFTEPDALGKFLDNLVRLLNGVTKGATSFSTNAKSPISGGFRA